MGFAVAYIPCGWCPYKESGERCGMCELTFRRKEWISVDERLPEQYKSVLVYMPEESPHPTVHEGFVNKHGKWYAGGFYRYADEVVAWMPMPEPPKRGVTDEIDAIRQKDKYDRL